MSFRGFGETVSISDKVISGTSYLTMGLVGFIWLIFKMIQKSSINQFVQYHIYQSIFLSVLVAITTILLGFILPIAKIIPFVGDLVMTVVALLSAGIIGSYSIVGFLLLLLQLYFAITAFMGKYSYFPWISDNVNQMINRY